MHTENPAKAEDRAGWRPKEWSLAAGVGRSMTYILMARNEIESVRVGRCRVIITAPREYLDRLAADQRDA
ncbi:MAG: hypothetical protein BroJett030_25880 [Alphaproteobacteria bacterium]|nr:MAG: hypothetical protein BroJett030_25880 [Alphaproteobacteria bacterium]